MPDQTGSTSARSATTSTAPAGSTQVSVVPQARSRDHLNRPAVSLSTAFRGCRSPLGPLATALGFHPLSKITTTPSNHFCTKSRSGPRTDHNSSSHQTRHPPSADSLKYPRAHDRACASFGVQEYRGEPERELLPSSLQKRRSVFGCNTCLGSARILGENDGINPGAHRDDFGGSLGI